MILTARNPDRLHCVGLEFGASIAAFDATDFDRLERFFDALPTLIDHLLVTGAGPDSKRHAATSTPTWSLPLQRCGVEHGVGEGWGGPHLLHTAEVTSRTALLLPGRSRSCRARESIVKVRAQSGEGRCVDAWSQNRGARCVGVAAERS
jgi:hypothetical protein